MKKLTILLAVIGLITAMFATTMIIHTTGGDETSFEIGNIESITFQNPALEIPTDYIAYYPFNGNADDESDNGFDGNINGASLSSDRFNNQNSAYNFDGVDDYIDIGSAANSTRTISLWFKSNIEIIDSNQITLSLIVRNTSNESDEWGINFQGIDGNGPNPGSIAFYRSNGNSGNHIESNLNNWEPNYWYHLCAVIDDISGMKLYVNNVLQSTNNTSTEAIPIRSEITAIGKHGNANIRYFNGVIDDIVFYNRVLSDEEIQSLYHEGGWE